MIATPELLSDPAYHDEDAARAYLESVRWADGRACPHCSTLDMNAPVGGPSMGPGWYYCSACKDKFTVRTGSVFERSHIPLHKWLLAIRLMASSKKGVSAHQLHRTLGITYKSAWFLGHRIREAMTDTNPTPLGGEGKIIEADETYFGRVGDPKDVVFVNEKGWVRRTGDEKMKVMTLVERGGKARSVQIDRATSAELNRVLAAKADPESRLMTDELSAYGRPGRRFASHDTVNHSADEYVRKLEDGTKAHTNSVEGYYSIFKRGMKGIYQHCSEKHLPRYLAEFDFRYSHRSRLGIEDAERTAIAVKGAKGKRLTYRRTRSQQADVVNVRARRMAREARQQARAERLAPLRAAGLRVYRPDEC
jgi:transposase-like protein